MNKNNIVKNVRYKLVKSINPKYIEVTVIFTRNGQIDRKFIFLEKVKGYKDKDYLKLAKEKFNGEFADKKITKFKKHKMPTAKASPLLVTFTCIFGITALSVAGLFTYQMLGGKFPKPYVPSNERTLTFNLENCTINGQSTYQKTYTRGDTIDKVTVTPSDDDHLLSKNSVNSEYQKYWDKASGVNFTFSDLVMDKDYTIDIKAVNAYTLELNLFGCTIDGTGEHSYSKKYAEGDTIDEVIVAPVDGTMLDNSSVPSEYQKYWKNVDGTDRYNLSEMVMEKNHSISIRNTDLRVLIINLTDCKVNNSYTYRKSYNEGDTIDSITVVPDSGYELTEDSVPSEYQDNWAPETGGTGNYILSGIEMNDDITIAINANEVCTLTLNLTNCTVDGETSYTETYKKGTTIEDIKVSPTDGYMLTEDSVPSEYQGYWNPEEGDTGNYILSGIEMNEDVTFEVNAGLAIKPSTGITITPNVVIPGKRYLGEIEVTNPETSTKVLPEEISLTNETHEDILFGYKLQLGRKNAVLEIPDNYTYSEITVTCDTVDEDDMWFKKDNWWEYCSNGETNQQAISADIGQEVEADVDGKPQPILLIDIDKDMMTPSQDPAHCTFEFKNPIERKKEGDFEKYRFHWNDKDGESTSKNFDFINNSTLGDKLMTTIGEIYNMIQSELTSAIVDVSKIAEVSSDSGQTYVETGYNTKLFPLSYDEMYGEEKDNRYEYYKDDATARPVDSWLRSPLTDPSTEADYDCFAWAAMGKTPLAQLVGRAQSGIAPAFCI